mmetsp:Transcript_525/g.2112  ORF Transcript_525/g.2112 Transcript_525/m.2112 type:complete len:235 (+) Transcript_525:295-999(+)
MRNLREARLRRRRRQRRRLLWLRRLPRRIWRFRRPNRRRPSRWLWRRPTRPHIQTQARRLILRRSPRGLTSGRAVRRRAEGQRNLRRLQSGRACASRCSRASPRTRQIPRRAPRVRLDQRRRDRPYLKHLCLNSFRSAPFPRSRHRRRRRPRRRRVAFRRPHLTLGRTIHRRSASTGKAVKALGLHNVREAKVRRSRVRVRQVPRRRRLPPPRWLIFQPRRQRCPWRRILIPRL